ncbi:hypothetical protein THAOC_04775, partial [Thalassiosira oceanica]
MGDRLQQAASLREGFLLYEGGKVAEELRRSLMHVRFAPHAGNRSNVGYDRLVGKIPIAVFEGCDKLIELQLNEGLQVIENVAFRGCTA